MKQGSRTTALLNWHPHIQSENSKEAFRYPRVPLLFTIFKISTILSISIPSVFTGHLFGSGCCGDTDHVEPDSYELCLPRAPVLTQRADSQLILKLSTEQGCVQHSTRGHKCYESIQNRIHARLSSVLTTIPFLLQKPNYRSVNTPSRRPRCAHARFPQVALRCTSGDDKDIKLVQK